jgi:excinuclease ABC subunit C
MQKQVFANIVNKLPNQPGIYKYYNQKVLIYVGKAKNIKKRVSSYFAKTQMSYKTKALVSNITSIDFTITKTERDALLLENSLIKEHQPKYNIDLKDDKTYPWIVIKNEPFPRVFFTRKKIKDGSTYLGPYTSVQQVRELLRSIKNNFPLRTCKLNLSEKEIAKKKYKVCLEYHLGNCKAPCVAAQTAADYQNNVQQVKNVLNGNIQPVVQHFKQVMQQHVAQLEFEKANIYKQRIEVLQNLIIRSEVVNVNVESAEVFTVKKIGDLAVVNYLIVESGNIISSHNQAIDLYADELEEEILQKAIPYLREKQGSKVRTIIVAQAIELIENDVELIVPKSGDKKKLLDFSTKNSLYHLSQLQKEKQQKIITDTNFEELLLDLQQDLQLQDTPYHIECFDNSNFQGTNAVSAMVCFKNGEPSKADYRHYNVKTVVGINDFATMNEVVTRRYKRLKEEQQSFPQLVIIDGGKGQLSAANEAISELGLQGKMTLVGLAKNVEEIFFVNDQESLKLPYNSKSLLLIRRIRDEVHRFGITHHRNKRSSNTFKTELTNIAGIGTTTANTLLKQFKSIQKIKQANMQELTTAVGLNRAQLIKKYFDGNDTGI